MLYSVSLSNFILKKDILPRNFAICDIHEVFKKG